MNPAPDPMALGQRLVQIIEVGRKTSTYKLATLLALIDVCLERLGNDPDAAQQVSLRDLADRVIELYWPQTRPYLTAGVLRQNSQSGRGLVEMIEELRRRDGRRGLTPGTLRESGDPGYAELRDRVAVRLASMPLTHLQVLPGGGSPFLYDEPWLTPRRQQSRRSLEAHDWSITLLPGVAWHLAALSGLLRPVLQLAWEALVIDLNAELEEDGLSGFLFGTSRRAMQSLAAPLSESQDHRCFYCGRSLQRARTHVDHVLPWSRIPLDGTANLVAADTRCNVAKSNALPVPEHHARAVARDADVLARIAGRQFPVLLEPTRRAGAALYRTSPVGTPLWECPGVYRPAPPAVP